MLLRTLALLETGIAVLLFCTYPAVTLVIERVVLKHRVRPIAVFCVAMILAGAGFIAAPGLKGGTIDLHGFLLIAGGILMQGCFCSTTPV